VKTKKERKRRLFGREDQEREKKTRENLVGIWVTQINKQTSDKQTNKQTKTPTADNKK